MAKNNDIFMTYLAKMSVIGVISFIIIAGFSVPATTYAWYGPTYFNYDMNFLFSNYQNQNYGGYSFPNYGSLYQKPQKTKEQLVVYAFGPTSGGPGGSSAYKTYSPSYTYTAPYNQPQYGYNSYSYQPHYLPVQAGGYGGYPQPTGNTDFFGKQLCNWGSDYQGYPCDQDPHQWIYDPYTGNWY